MLWETPVILGRQCFFSKGPETLLSRTLSYGLTRATQLEAGRCTSRPQELSFFPGLLSPSAAWLRETIHPTVVAGNRKSTAIKSFATMAW